MPNSTPSIRPLPAGVGTITSNQGQRNGKPHDGVDIAATLGTPVLATADGTVLSTGWVKGYGNTIDIAHGNGIISRYAHLSRIDVSNGVAVTRGQTIGGVGSTGRSTGPHLHYEVRKNGVPQNPLDFMSSGAVTPSAAGTRNQPAEAATTGNSDGGAATTSSSTATLNVGVLAPSSQKNSLHRYRSYTYNFTFGAVSLEASRSRNLADLDQSIQNHCVFDTSGKAKNGGIKSVNTGTNLQQRQQLAQGFNENSPGAYDFYVEDLSIENQLTIIPTPTKLEMTICEPYSVNGLYEALQTAAVSAGYDKYIGTPFCLKIQFKGYRDDNDQIPEIVPNTTRYLMVTLTKFEMSITDEGAKYKCLATAEPDQSFGFPNKQIKSITASGNTVFEVLKSYFRELNEASKNNATRASGEGANLSYDQYEIAAPLLVTPGSPQNVMDSLIFSPARSIDPPSAGPQHNDIVKANIIQNIAQNARQTTDPSVIVAAYSAIPGSKDSPQSDRASPTAPTFTFHEGQQIHEAINAIILNSEYVRTDVLQQQLPAARESNKTVTYFKIRMEVDLQSNTIDPRTGRMIRIHRYIIEPYLVIYTAIPPYDRSTDNFQPLMNQVRRTYYFTYTGKNNDVLKFDLKLDALFFNEIPSGLGNNDEAHPGRGTPVALAPSNSNRSYLQVQPETGQPGDTARTNYLNSTNVGINVGNELTRAGLMQTDPYHLMADAVHRNFLFHTYANSTIDMDIIGDPYYLVTGQTRNFNLELSSGFETVGGEAAVTQQQLCVLILMKNINDISKNSEPSLAVFRENNFSTWSGLYTIDGVRNKFKDGQFTQTLKLRIVNGHVLDNEGTTALTIGTRPATVPGSNVTPDSAPPSVNKIGKTSNGADLVNLIGRGVAGIGAAIGAVNAVQAIFSNRESGTTDVSQSQLGVNSSIDQRSGIVDVSVSPSLLNSEIVSDTAAAVGMAGTIVNQVANANNASINLADELTNSVPGIPNSLRQDVETLPQNSLAQVGNAPSGIEILQNPILTDPNGTASRLGIEPAKIAGLSQNLASKVTDQLNEISEILPPNVNLASLESQGLVFKNMSKSDLANLPALQPSTKVMPVTDDPAVAPIVDSFGSVAPLLNGLTNLPPLTDNSKITNSMGYVSSAGLANDQPFSQSMIDKVETAQRLINDVSATAYGVPASSKLRNNNAIARPTMSELGLGSKESNYATVGSLVQSSPRDTGHQLGMTLAAQFGSRASNSPLTTLIHKTNIRERNR